MGQSTSGIPWLRAPKELSVVLQRSYSTKHYNLTCLRLQPGGRLLAAASENGTVLLYDLFSEAQEAQQYKILGFELGGISELLWIDGDHLAVGTTRGRIVILSLKNEAKRFFEICNVKAHGDGAALNPVQNMDFYTPTRQLVSTGQGSNCIRLWHVNQEGALSPVAVDGPTAYCEPRYISFLQDAQLCIGYFENMTFQIYTLGPGCKLISEHLLGHDNGAIDDRQLGNAVKLEEGKLAVFNLKDGFDIYEVPKFILPAPIQTYPITIHSPPQDAAPHLKRQSDPHRGSNETLRVVFLCIAVYAILQLMTASAPLIRSQISLKQVSEISSMPTTTTTTDEASLTGDEPRPLVTETAGIRNAVENGDIEQKDRFDLITYSSQ